MDALFQSSYNGLNAVQIQMVQPSILKSQKPSKMIETHFVSFVFHNDWIQNHCWFSLKSMTHNFVPVFSVLLPIGGQICQGLPFQCIFVEGVVPLLGTMTDKCVWTLVCGRN